jgi:hypothetical protein
MTYTDPNASFSGRPEDQPTPQTGLEALAALQRTKQPAGTPVADELTPGTPVKTADGAWGIVLEAGPELPANTPGLPDNYHPGYVLGLLAVSDRRYHPEDLTPITAPAKNTKT